LKLVVLVTFPVIEDVFKKMWDCVDKAKTTVHFLIENEEQFELLIAMKEDYGIANYKIIPVYTGDNLSFFEENVYVGPDDLFQKTLSMREIFRNQKLNINFFGSLSILPDGTVKANMNKPPIGNTKTDSIMSLIFKEMLENTAWRVIRDTKPCSECIYQFFCPPPSNYETAIGKPDLCKINF